MAEPAPSRLLLLRHGRTSWNHLGIAQGQADVPLDRVGHAQAAAVADLLARRSPSRLWSSDLARAQETAAYVAQACGLPVATDPRLREYAVGERQGLTWAESLERFPWLAAGTTIGERLRDVPGAEDDADVDARVVPAVEECLAALGPGETGVVVSHGAALKRALAGLLGWPESVIRSLAGLDNCRWIAVAARPGGGRRLLEYGGGACAEPEATG